MRINLFKFQRQRFSSICSREEKQVEEEQPCEQVVGIDSCDSIKIFEEENDSNSQRCCYDLSSGGFTMIQPNFA